MADPKPSYTSSRKPKGFKSVKAMNAAQRIIGKTSSSSSVFSSASASSSAVSSTQHRSSASSSASSSSLREGCKIEHLRFGIGTVLKIEGTGENAKATVEFQNLGTKQLLLKFAKFKIIG